MVVGPRSALAIEGERASPVVEPLAHHIAELTIIARLRTPHSRIDPPSSTPDTVNPNPNGLGSSSPPRLSPLGNWVIRRVIQLPHSTGTQSATGQSGVVLMHVPQTRWCCESGSASKNREMGVRKTVGRSMEQRGWQRW
jgi:hypothetical protein